MGLSWRWVKEDISLQVMLHFQVFSLTEPCIKLELSTTELIINNFSQQNSNQISIFTHINKEIIESNTFFIITRAGNVKYICMSGSFM